MWWVCEAGEAEDGVLCERHTLTAHMSAAWLGTQARARMGDSDGIVPATSIECSGVG